MKLLIVDDNATNLKLLRAQMEVEGHDVVEASNGAEALRILQRESMGGVISDILMPEMDGYRLCLEVRKDPGLHHIPFVLYTSTYNSPADRQLAKNVGADAYISKPAPTPIILDALRAAAARAAPRPELPRHGEADVLKKYSEVLVRKLEDKNLDLERSLVHLQLAHQEARRADALHGLVFENVPVGVTITGADGVVVSANMLIARMLGYDNVHEALGALGGKARGVYAEPGVREEYVERLRRDGTVRSFEAQLVRRNGSRFWASLDGRVVPATKGQPALLVTIVNDITQRREQEHRIARLSRVKDMHSAINSAVAHIRERQSLLNEVCNIAVDKGGLRAAWVGWHDVAARKIFPIASAGKFDGFLELVNLSTQVTPGQADSNAVQVILDGRPRVNNDLVAASGHLYQKEALERGYLAMMHLPLVVGEAATTEGVLILYSSEAGFFDDDEVRLLEELAADVSFALESLRKSERLEYLAYYDPLTGLPNRSLFQDRLSHSLRQRGGDARLIAVILLDLERFRRVNETLGRKSGDELLKEVGTRLLRLSDSAARIGADVFGLVLRGARTAAEVNRALEAILAPCFAESFGIRGEELRTSCRAGVALYPDDGAEPDVLMRNAEAALRLSKRSSDRIVFYASEMHSRVADALAIENKLRLAVERREFVLHYQPKVALATGSIVGAEALIRWQEPGKGLVPPGQFIPILEETGLIVEVGRWALEQAFVDLRAWAAQGIKVSRIAVNVSSIQLQRKDFVDSVVDEIQRGGDNPEWLELEITESLVMRNVEDSIRKLSVLRGMGVTVAIDDFGTGYSSLSYLGRLPVDTLKIDRSFITGVATSEDSTTLVTTVIALAHGLKLKVVAEGVETAEQANALRLFRCDEAQGYLYSRPVPASDIEKLFRAGRTG